MGYRGGKYITSDIFLFHDKELYTIKNEYYHVEKFFLIYQDMQGTQERVRTVTNDSVLPKNHLTPLKGMRKKGADLNNFANLVLTGEC